MPSNFGTSRPGASRQSSATGKRFEKVCRNILTAMGGTLRIPVCPPSRPIPKRSLRILRSAYLGRPTGAHLGRGAGDRIAQQEQNEWNADNLFYWRFVLRGGAPQPSTNGVNTNLGSCFPPTRRLLRSIPVPRADRKEAVLERPSTNFESPWNPARLEQRVGRVHRFGQTQPVQVIHLLTENIIEERVFGKLLGSKRRCSRDYSMKRRTKSALKSSGAKA